MIGLLWFDNTPKKPLQSKIEEAVARYAEKFLAMPEVVEVNPADFEAVSLGKIAVRGRGNILRHHLLVGVEASDPHPGLPPNAGRAPEFGGRGAM